jgi:hypothetical protein
MPYDIHGVAFRIVAKCKRRSRRAMILAWPRLLEDEFATRRFSRLSQSGKTAGATLSHGDFTSP